MKPKIVILTSRFPFPLEKGDKLRAYYFIKELSKFYRVVLVSLSDKKVIDNEFKELEKICDKVYLFRLKKVQILFNLFYGLFNDKPFQINYFYSYTIQKKVKKILEDEVPDHIYCQLIRVTEYVKNYHNCPKTIDYMDALSKGIQRRKNIAPWYVKWIFKIEYERLLNYESVIYDYFETHLIISDQDRKQIIHPDRYKIKVIPNGIDATFFEEIKTDKKFDLVFVGNLSYAPNKEAVYYLIDRIISKSNYTCLISGANPSNSLISKIDKSKNVTLWANVDDIRLSYCSAKIFIAPLFIGTGLQNKLLEAMALGIPCITTDLVNSSLNAKVESEIDVANTPESFIDKINKITSDKTLYQSMKIKARSYIKNNFSWEKSIQMYEGHLKKNKDF